MSYSTSIFQVSLLVAVFLCTIVFGFILLFAIVVIMPGIGLFLDNGSFLRVFQVIDGIIQRKQPVFVSIWVGSVIALLVAAGLGWGELDGSQPAWIVTATVAYMVAQVTTFTFNVPLNNRLPELEIEFLDATRKATERAAFEQKWNVWNWFWTVTIGFVALAISRRALVVYH
jgi:hypothetical protein